MLTDTVQIVRLEPMRVASVLGFGPEPERLSWEKLLAYARPKGWLEPPYTHRIFGFNNPSPSAGSPNYGYELWITVGPEAQPEPGVEIKDVPGGLYAVARWDGQGDPGSAIPAAWQRLVMWREQSRYHSARHQWLEESPLPAGVPGAPFLLDLYLPIAE